MGALFPSQKTIIRIVNSSEIQISWQQEVLRVFVTDWLGPIRDINSSYVEYLVEEKVTVSTRWGTVNFVPFRMRLNGNEKKDEFDFVQYM